MKKIIKPAHKLIVLGKENLVKDVIDNVSRRTKVYIGNENNKSVICEVIVNDSGGLSYDGGRGPFPIKEEYEIFYFED